MAWTESARQGLHDPNIQLSAPSVTWTEIRAPSRAPRAHAMSTDGVSAARRNPYPSS